MVKVARLKCRIYELPISYSGRDYAEGKEIGSKDGPPAASPRPRAIGQRNGGM
jgi:hypothetical protein